MKTSLIVFLSILCLFLLILVFLVIKKNKMSLKYSLLWIIFVLMIFISLLFHNQVFYVSKFLGFEVTSNMVFLIGFVSLMIITFVLTSIISRQNEKIVALTQEMAILNKKVKELDDRDYL